MLGDGCSTRLLVAQPPPRLACPPPSPLALWCSLRAALNSTQGDPQFLQHLGLTPGTQADALASAGRGGTRGKRGSSALLRRDSEGGLSER